MFIPADEFVKLKAIKNLNLMLGHAEARKEENMSYKTIYSTRFSYLECFQIPPASFEEIFRLNKYIHCSSAV